jgi:hypothetical protein
MNNLASTAILVGNEAEPFEPTHPFLPIIAIHIPCRLSQHITDRTPVQVNAEASLRRDHAGARWDARLYARDGRHHLRGACGGSGWPAGRSRGDLSGVPIWHLGGMQHGARTYIAHRHSRLAQRERLHVHAPYIARGG